MTKQIPTGYKQTKVGVIPEDWKIEKISKIFTKVSNPVKVDINEQYQEIGIRSHGKGIFYKEKILGEKLGNKSVFWIEQDCLILNIVFAWEQAIAKTTEQELGMIASHRFPMYKPTPKLASLDYFLYFFKSKKGKACLELASPGGAGRNKTLGQSEFAQLDVSLPPLKEQGKITEILLTWDNAIIKQQQLIEQKQLFKKGIMQQIFSQKIRFKNDNGNNYPTWQPKKLINCLFSISLRNSQILSSEINQTGKYPVIDQIQQYIVGYSDTEKSYKDHPVIIYGDHTTTVKYINFDFIVGGDGTKILKTFEEYNLKFMYYVVEIFNIPQEGYKRHFSILKSLSFDIPQSLNEQFKIANFLTSVDDEISKQTEILDQMKLQKQSLMQKLLTGQVRVRRKGN